MRSSHASALREDETILYFEGGKQLREHKWNERQALSLSWKIQSQEEKRGRRKKMVKHT